VGALLMQVHVILEDEEYWVEDGLVLVESEVVLEEVQSTNNLVMTILLSHQMCGKETDVIVVCLQLELL
jgi:hypothetical protein